MEDSFGPGGGDLYPNVPSHPLPPSSRGAAGGPPGIHLYPNVPSHPLPTSSRRAAGGPIRNYGVAYDDDEEDDEFEAPQEESKEESKSEEDRPVIARQDISTSTQKLLIYMRIQGIRFDERDDTDIGKLAIVSKLMYDITPEVLYDLNADTAKNSIEMLAFNLLYKDCEDRYNTMSTQQKNLMIKN